MLPTPIIMREVNPLALKWPRNVLHRALIVLALCAGPAAGAPTSELAAPWRVLVLLGGDPGQIAVQQQDQAFRMALLAAAPNGVDFFTESLDTVRFRYADQATEFLALQRKKYATQRVDLVVGLGGLTIDFINRHHNDLWPQAPVLLYSINEVVARRVGMPAAASFVPWRHNIEGTLSLIENLQPQARRLIAIGGTTESDRALTARVAALAGARALWQTETWNELTIPQLRQRVAALDRSSAIVFTTLSRDATGQAMFPADALQRFASVSAAPIYGLYTSYLGRGVTAGHMADFEGNGRRAGEVAAALLSGQASAVIEQPIPTKCVADYALLVTHGLSPSGLPADCELRNAPRGLWQDYGAFVAAALGVLVLQALTIGALLVQRQRRRKAEAEATERRLELGRAARFAAMGELTASIAHEINQPLGAILANTDAAAMMLRSGTASEAQLGEMLADIRREDLRASEVIRRLRALLEKRVVTQLPFHLHPVLDDALGLLASEARRRGVVIERSFDARDDQLLGDAVQLQQVLINLALNAMDAMQQQAPGRRQLSIRTVDGNGEVELHVADRGCGISDAQHDKVFDSFVTTKPHGMGLGLSIVRSIVEAHGGRIGFAPREGGGTVFTVTFPRRLGVPAGAFDGSAAVVPT
jgi:signal transduction histidine kinase